MKILQFLQDQNGQFSNARLGNFLVIAGFTTDYFMHIIRGLEYNPSWSIVGIVSAIMGIKVAQKVAENANKSS